MIISFHSGILLFPPKQEVVITSVCQTGNFPVLLLWFVRNRRGDDADVNNKTLFWFYTWRKLWLINLDSDNLVMQREWLIYMRLNNCMFQQLTIIYLNKVKMNTFEQQYKTTWHRQTANEFIKLGTQSIHLKRLLRLHFINTNWR